MSSIKDKVVDTSAILFNVDGSIKYVSLANLSSKHLKDTLYIFLPNEDDDNYLLIEYSEYMKLKRATIRYEMSVYHYLEDYNEEERLDSTVKEIEVFTPYEFYLSIWNILKIRMITTLFFEMNLEFSSIEGFNIENMHIEVELDNGTVDILDWVFKPGVSLQSNTRKLCYKLCKQYHIPWKEFRMKEKVFKVCDDMWDVISYDSIEYGDLVGLISDMAMIVQFMTWTPQYEKILSEIVDVEISGFDKKSILDAYPDFDKHKKEKAYLSKIDTGEISEAGYAISFMISYGYNDKYTLLSNLKYICKYVEAFIAWNYNTPYEDCVCIILVSFIRSKGNSEDYRVEVTITKDNTDFLI